MRPRNPTRGQTVMNVTSSNVLALQSELAQAIAREVRVKLTPQEQAHLAHLQSVEPPAYEAYLQGRYHWSKGSNDSLNRAIQYFNDAIQIDPAFAPGYAGLADAYSDLAVFNFKPPTKAFPKVKDPALIASGSACRPSCKYWDTKTSA